MTTVQSGTGPVDWVPGLAMRDADRTWRSQRNRRPRQLQKRSSGPSCLVFQLAEPVGAAESSLMSVKPPPFVKPRSVVPSRRSWTKKSPSLWDWKANASLSLLASPTSDFVEPLWDKSLLAMNAVTGRQASWRASKPRQNARSTTRLALALRAARALRSWLSWSRIKRADDEPRLRPSPESTPGFSRYFARSRIPPRQGAILANLAGLAAE
jgi:hypothetical protein